MKSFKDCKILVVMFKSFYAWMVAYNSPPFSFTEFLDLFFFFSLIKGLSCIFRVYWVCTPLRFLMRLIFLLIKVIIQYVKKYNPFFSVELDGFSHIFPCIL
jgi:hypothetical protein